MSALETARLGVRVNAISPGGVVTPMFLRFTGGNKEMQTGFAMRTPSADWPVPRTSRSILFMASDDASFMTGSVVAVDGGYTAQ